MTDIASSRVVICQMEVSHECLHKLLLEHQKEHGGSIAEGEKESWMSSWMTTGLQWPIGRRGDGLWRTYVPPGAQRRGVGASQLLLCTFMYPETRAAGIHKLSM